MKSTLPLVSSTLDSSSPPNFSFSIGQCLRRGVSVFKIVEIYDDHLVLQHLLTFERKLIQRSSLYKEYLNSQIFPCNSADISRAASGDVFSEDDARTVQLTLSDASEATLSHGRKLMRYIQELRRLGYQSLKPSPLLEMEFERVKQKLGNRDEFADGVHPKLSTVHRAALRLDKSGGNWAAVFPNYSKRGGRNLSRIDTIASKALDQVLDRLEQSPNERINYSSIRDELEATLQSLTSVDEMLEMVPSLSTVERRTKARFSEYEVCRRNKGKTAADKEFRDFFPRDRAERPLEVVEFDDKDTRVFLIDEKTGLPWGRAFITFGIDQATTVPLGFSINEHYRSSWSATNAFANSILPKDTNTLALSYVASDAEFFGIPSIALFDNALYNHSNALRSAVLEMSNTTTAWAKPHTPTEKSVVEDFNGQMVEKFLHKLPGFGGPKKSKDGLADGLASATMSSLEFCQKFFKWVYDEFCNDSRSDGMSPRQLWHRDVYSAVPRLPADLMRIEASIGIPHQIQLRPDGILFTGLSYQHPKLILFKKIFGSKYLVTFRYNPQRLEKIYVLDPKTNSYFVVPSTCPEYTNNLTLHQHRLIRKMARENGQKNPSRSVLLQTRQELAQLTLQARHSKRFRERRWSQHISSVDENGRLVELESPSIEIISDLEYQIRALDDVEMDTSDEGWNLPKQF